VTASTAAPSAVCPRCAASTVAIGLRKPWCPGCDWNLDQEPPVVFGLAAVDRRLYRVARRLTEGQFEGLVNRPLAPRTMTAARLTTLTAAVVLLAGVLATAVLGVWLVLVDFFSFSTVFGALLIGVAVVLRPRLGRLATLAQRGVFVTPEQAPQLYALVKRVADAVNAPAPQRLMIGYDLNAFTTAVGLRRTRVLCFGLPLWATLSPQERVALIGHELGHFMNGDVRRGPLTEVAVTTLDRVAYLFTSERSLRGGFVEYIVELITQVLSHLVAGTARTLQLLLVWTSQRDSQRAEYLADEMAARVAGTDAAVGLADHLVMTASIDTVVRREARAGNGMSSWHDAARAARGNLAAKLPLLRRLTRHTDVSLYYSHPPAGLRAEMLERRPRLAAAVTLTETEAARIDGELAVHQKRVLRELTA
jgi:Zn-dependent protease with chaperone function